MICATLIGFGLSSLFLGLSYALKSDLLYWPQFVGFFICWVPRGIHNATVTDYWAIAMPVNAIVYAIVILLGHNFTKRLGRK